MRTWNRTAVVVVPKQPFLDWLRSVDPTSADLTLENLSADPTVYLLAEAQSDSAADRLLAAACENIFEEQLDSWHHAPESWPKDRRIRTFRQWFTYSFHSMIIDLCDRPLQAEEL